MLGGLGLFLFGMKLMSDGLEKAAGAKLRRILEIFTTNRFTGMLVGIVFTGIIQSSSAATVMVVSFVNAGLMNLSQAAGVILGANIGTTVTSQLVSFNLSEIAPVFLLAGVIMVEFIDNPTIRKFGEVVLGFGILFTGLTTMSGAMSSLKDSPLIMNALGSLDNHFLGVLFGFVLTAILQSSSVTVSIVLLMASQGLLPLAICFFIILGCNMGSCVSALLASLGGNKNAKRAAMIHFLFNIFGSIIIFAGLSFALDGITDFFLRISGGNIGRSVANAHTTFKVIEVLVMFPSAKWIVALATKIIPGTDVKLHSTELQYIGEHSLNSPTTVIPQAKLEIQHLAQITKKNLELSMRGFLHKEDQYLDEIYQREESINYISHAITDYLVESNQLSLPVADRALLGGMFHVVSDIERIGDHAENFADFTRTELKHDTGLSDEAKEEIHTMYASVSKLMDLSIETFMDNTEENFPVLNELEDSIDHMERKYQKRHIKRMAQGTCDPQAGLLFSDMLSALERIADHSMNIAFSANENYDDEEI
jgi:phosphate:Na+ symporter